MKLKKEDILKYKCDICEDYKTHITMHDINICENCWSKMRPINPE